MALQNFSFSYVFLKWKYEIIPIHKKNFQQNKKKLNLYFKHFLLWSSEYICILRKYQIFEIHSAVCGQYVLACLRYPNMKYENGFDTGGTWCHYIVNTIMMTTLDILFIWMITIGKKNYFKIWNYFFLHIIIQRTKCGNILNIWS